MIMLRELLRYSILTSVIAIVGCSTIPKEDSSSILMEDVIVERTTVRSTTQNPKPKPSGGGVYISGDNINIGTIIVNSPGAKVDNSTNTYTQVNQQNNTTESQYQTRTGPQRTTSLFIQKKPEPAYDTERDFFRDLDKVALKLVPSFIMGSGIR
jgi:hypothetical protein